MRIYVIKVPKLLRPLARAIFRKRIGKAAE